MYINTLLLYAFKIILNIPHSSFNQKYQSIINDSLTINVQSVLYVSIEIKY